MTKSEACCSFMARRWGRKLPRSHPRLRAKSRNRSGSRPQKQPKKRCKGPSWTIRVSDKMHGWPIPATEFNTATRNRRTARSNQRSSRILNKFLQTNSRNSHALLKALLDLDVHTERAVLIAQPDNRNIAVQVVLHLDHLLLGGAHVGDIGYRQIAGNLLLHGHARPDVLPGSGGAKAGETGIDAETGDSKQTLHTAPLLAGTRFSEQSRGSAVAGRARLPSDASVYRGLRSRLAECQKGDDVVSGQRRIGAIRQAHLAGLAGEIEGDLVLLDVCGGFEVDHRVHAERVGEIQVAAGNFVTIIVKVEIARQNVDVSQENRVLGGAPGTQA